MSVSVLFLILMITCTVHSQYYYYYNPYSQNYYYPYYTGYYYPQYLYYFYPVFPAFARTQGPTTAAPRPEQGGVLQILQKYAPVGFTYLGLFREFLTAVGK